MTKSNIANYEENKTNKEIDFSQMLTEYRKRTEFNMPHTAQQVEDVIFVSQDRLVALEYIFYSTQNYNKYYNLEAQTTKQSWRKTLTKINKWNTSVGFLNEPKIYHQSKKPVPMEDGQFIEASISLWKINSSGHLIKLKQTPFEIGKSFIPTKQGQMQLFLSPDKSIVTLGIIQDFPMLTEDKAEHLKNSATFGVENEIKSESCGEKQQASFLSIKCWKASSLEKVMVSEGLRRSLKESLKGSLNEINYVGGNKYVLLTQTCESAFKDQQQKHQQIFDRSSGDKIFEIGNYDANKLADKLFQGEIDKSFQFVGMLAKNVGLHDINQQLQKTKSDSDISSKTPLCQKMQTNTESTGSQIDSFNISNMNGDQAAWRHEMALLGTDTKELILVFFFVGTVDGTTTEKQREKQTTLTFVELDILQFLNKSESKGRHPDDTPDFGFEQVTKDILVSGLSKYCDFHESKREFFEIPKSWFINELTYDEKQWYTDIDIGANKTFNQIGVLNRRERLYLAFDIIDNDAECDSQQINFQSKEIGRFHVAENSICNIIRNQQTKDYLFLSVRTKGTKQGGFQAHCFFKKTGRLSISFSKQHIHACQDVQTIPLKQQGEATEDTNIKCDKIKHEKVENRILLQSCSIQEYSQEINLKTEMANVQGKQDLANVMNSSITQRLSANFPLMAYNLGLKKILIQNTQGQQLAFILELKNDDFVDFVDFDHLLDLNFDKDQFKKSLSDIQEEMCSDFAFLTRQHLPQGKPIIILNILFVNPYLQEIKVAHFQSIKCFEDLEESDQIIKNIMFSTRSNSSNTDSKTRLITQFSSSLVVRDFKSKNDVYENNHASHTIYEQQDDSQMPKQQANDKNKILLGRLEPIQMVLSQDRCIYYVTSLDNFYTVNKIDLKQDDIHDHKQVLEKRLKQIKSFGQMESRHEFYIIDDHKNLTVLRENENTNSLSEAGQYFIKDHEKPAFSIKPFEVFIVSRKYIINESRIFYLTDHPFTKSMMKQAILNMEDLSYIEDANDSSRFSLSILKLKSFKTQNSCEISDHSKIFSFGPIKFKGSQQFLIIYESTQAKDFAARIYSLPDSSMVSLLNQNLSNSKSQLSTFFQVDHPDHEHTHILMKQGSQFSVFDDNGVFICLVKQKYLEEVFDDTPTTKTHGHESTRLSILTMSSNIKYFLFIDSHLNKLVVYQLTIAQEAQRQVTSQNGTLMRQFTQKFKIKFRLQIELNYELIPLYSLNVDIKIEEFQTGKISMQLTDEGDVILITHQECDEGDEDMNRKVDVQIFRLENQGNVPITFTQFVAFPENNGPETRAYEVWEEKSFINMQIKEERARQEHLPNYFQDNTQIEQLQNKCKDLEKKLDSVVQCYLFGRLMLIVCGYQVKFGFLPSKTSEQVSLDSNQERSSLSDINFKMCMSKFKLITQQMDCEFSDNIEIVTLMETRLENIIQIIAKDNVNNILIVMSWDFNKNIEHSIYQVKVNPEESRENQIARGLKGPLNYFMGDFFIYDLQNNIPFQQTARLNNNGEESLAGATRGLNQAQKFYLDHSRYLCIKSGNCLYFPVNRIDILFWRSILENHKENLSIIKKNFRLKNFAKIFDKSQSLFHYFATNVKVIEMFHKRFLEAKQNSQLEEFEEEIPLLMTLPNQRNKTAMDIAMQQLKPQSFELMIDLLVHFEQHMLTKMMLNVIPDMIVQNSMLVKKFFDSCIYKSPSMEVAHVINWPQQKDQLIFPWHTSIISRKIAFEQIEKHLSSEQIDQIKLDQINKRREAGKDNTKETEFNQSQLQDFRSFIPVNSLKKRVNVEAIDLDWVFKGNNAKNLILLLQNYGKGDIFNSKVLRIFINIIWGKYQPQIIKWVFIPFLIYLYNFVYLSSALAGPFLDQLINIENEKTRQEIEKQQWQVILHCLICFAGVIYFASIEYKQIRLKGPSDYFSDRWNFFDIAFLTTCAIYLFLVVYFTIQKQFHFYWVFKLRLFGGITCFLMWAKMFYWMRIFNETAHFVTLIGKTLSDIKVFCLMLTIILFAFSNFFFTINNNTSHNETYANSDRFKDRFKDDLQDSEKGEFTYLQRLYYNCYINSILNVYLLMLGEFYFEDFSKGPNDEFAWIGFILATFIVLIVFMNLLIAIMGETFNQVKEQNQQSLLTEQLGLIEDHLWLVDLQQQFKGQKYIIRLSPDEAGFSGDSSMHEQLQSLCHNIVTKNEGVQEVIKHSNSQTEQRMRQMIKQQQVKTNKTSQVVQEKSQEFNNVANQLRYEVSSQLQDQKEGIEKLLSRIESRFEEMGGSRDKRDSKEYKHQETQTTQPQTNQSKQKNNKKQGQPYNQ